VDQVDENRREQLAVARRIDRATQNGGDPNINDVDRLVELVLATERSHEVPDGVPARLNGRPVIAQVQIRPGEWLVLVEEGENRYASAWWAAELGTSWQWARHLPDTDRRRALRAYVNRLADEVA
jgi:hypothetical protein